MARKVRCAITGEYGTSDTFIKIDGRYYKNQVIYNEHKRQTEYWQKIITKFAYDFLDYKPGQPFPTILTKKLKELNFYDNETIYKTIEFSEDDIHRALETKDFDSDYRRINYILAIVRNNINKVWKGILQERREKRDPNSDNPILIEQMCSQIQNPRQKIKDISRFLEDDYYD